MEGTLRQRLVYFAVELYQWQSVLISRREDNT